MKSKLKKKKSKHSKLYLRRVKNNKYQAPQLGDLGIRMRGPQYKQNLQSFTCDPCTKKKVTQTCAA